MAISHLDASCNSKLNNTQIEWDSTDYWAWDCIRVWGDSFQIVVWFANRCLVETCSDCDLDSDWDVHRWRFRWTLGFLLCFSQFESRIQMPLVSPLYLSSVTLWEETIWIGLKLITRQSRSCELLRRLFSIWKIKTFEVCKMLFSLGVLSAS